MGPENFPPARMRWARFRFSVVGPLLSAPAKPGELQERLRELAAQAWKHPTTGETLRLSFKTIERWYYSVHKADSPIDELARKVPKQAGTHPSVSEALGEAIARQYREHPRWTHQLHYDNLRALSRQEPFLCPMPGYATVCRYMKHHGFLRVRRRPRVADEGFVPRETRSYEVEHVHGLWHLDFHEGSRRVITAAGEWQKPQLLGILDDRSRLCCHLQWYLSETAESLIHGLSQAIQKRGLPRALLTDNGSAMIAAETEEGLERLGILHRTTLPASPEQNGKQECFWGQIEGRLLPMLEGEKELTLALLNIATQAWVEGEYNVKEHSEIHETPLERYLRGPSVRRDSPSSEALRRAFRSEVTRQQRRSDGTVTVEGIRFEVPSAYRTLVQLRLRVGRWDLSSVDLVDPRTGSHLCSLWPLDKAKNADGARRALPVPEGSESDAPDDEPPSGMAPLLRSLMADYAATGLPPGYLPKDDSTKEKTIVPDPTEIL